MNARAWPIALLVMVSGACALVLQIGWMRELRLIFGASTPATAAVVAIFMGGLGVGNAVLGKRADRATDPLRLYAGLEMGISAVSMLSPWLVWLVRSTYVALGGQEALGIAGAAVVRLLLATVVLGPATFLMGGTLPSAACAVTRADDLSRRYVGLLYGLNTLGAVIGSVLGTFLLLEWLGTRVTLWTACLVNLLNALAAWKLAQSGPVREMRTQEPEVRNQKAVTSPQSPNPKPEIQNPVSIPEASIWPGALYVVAGLVGMVFFLMELVWYRMLGPILGGSTFTFGLILAVALAGIGVGGAIYPLVFHGRQPTVRTLALTLAWEALFIAVPLALGDRLAVLALVLRLLAYYGFIGKICGWLAVTMIVVFPAAVVSGIQFPILVALVGQGRRRVGNELGRMFCWNAAGAIAGSLAGGFGLLPLLSAPGAWMLAAMALNVLAVAALFGARLQELKKHQRAEELARDERLRFGSWVLRCFDRSFWHPAAVASLTVSGLAAACLTATGPTAVWRHSGIGAGRAQMPAPTPNDLRAWMNAERRAIVWEAEGREMSVAASGRRGIALVANGKSDGNAISDAGTQIMLGVLGVLLHPHPRAGLVIGLGTGESAGWLAHQPVIERVDVIELEPAVAHVAALCGPLNHDVLRHPKVQIVYNDAREALLTTRRRYDLIASEPSNPYRYGVSSLYTREFYGAVADRLNRGGIFLQWLQGYEIDAFAVRSVVCTLADVFGHVEIWESDPSDLVFVCSQEPLRYTAAELGSRIREPAMREALRVAWRTATLEGVLSHLAAGEPYARELAERRLGVVNTDDRNVLEFGFARSVGESAGFTITGLRMEAAAAGMLRGPRLEGGVDWEAVEDARIAFYAVSGDSPLAPDLFAGERAARAESLAALRAGPDLAFVARRWHSQPKTPQDLVETLAVAMGLAAQADARALEVAESIRVDCPIEFDVIAAILAARQRRSDQAAAKLAGAFVALRKDATAMPLVVEHALRAALEVADQDGRQLPPLYQALREPFAVFMAQDRRATALCLLGQRLGARELAEAMLPLEPHPPWDLKMLQWRAAAYAQIGHPLAGRARRDLADFQRHAPTSAVLVGQ